MQIQSVGITNSQLFKLQAKQNFLSSNLNQNINSVSFGQDNYKKISVKKALLWGTGAAGAITLGVILLRGGKVNKVLSSIGSDDSNLVRTSTKLKSGNELTYVSKDGVRQSGTLVNPKGVTLVNVIYKKGKISGKEIFNSNGVLVSQTSYVNGKKHISKKIRPDGNIAEEIYAEGKLSKIVNKTSGGLRFYETEYFRGKKFLEKSFHEDGKTVRTQLLFVDGKQARIDHFSQKGVLTKTQDYKKGVLESERIYGKNGKLSTELTYDSKGQKQSYVCFREDGTRWTETIYENNKPVRINDYAKDGETIIRTKDLK